MKILYLASGQAKIENFDITYQDIKVARDIGGDMMNVDLTNYDVIIATPPCNYYSRANYRREKSEYSQATKHLLPEIIKKLEKLGKPYIVENVRNTRLLRDIYPLSKYVLFHGRHTYFTNVDFPEIVNIIQIEDKVQDKTKSARQGGDNVNIVIEAWLQKIKKEKLNEI